VEALGAVAALEQKRPSALRGRELALQLLDLPRRHERRQPRELREHTVELLPRTVGGLLGGLARLPAGGMPIGGDGNGHRGCTGGARRSLYKRRRGPAKRKVSRMR